MTNATRRNTPGLISSHRAITAIFLSMTVGGCSKEQSVLAAKGVEAEQIETLSYVLFAGGAAILTVIVTLLAAALFLPDRFRRFLAGESAIVAGGIVFPTIVLTALLIYGISTTARLRAQEDSDLRIFVEGKQWWWRVRYDGPGLQPFESANEIRIPVDRPVEFILSSGDVIHSFWVPGLAGKLDMIPGRTTTLRARARHEGMMRGQCAEFCGGPHGLMALRVIAMPQAEFVAWLTQRHRAVPPRPPSAGERLFMAAGCGGCHAIDGTKASGTIGPNLTALGTRHAIAAETLPLSRENLARWIAHNQDIKPENLMPPFRNLTAGELSLLSAYLEQLK